MYKALEGARRTTLAAKSSKVDERVAAAYKPSGLHMSVASLHTVTELGPQQKPAIWEDILMLGSDLIEGNVRALPHLG